VLLALVSGITFFFRRQAYRRKILELERAHEIENIRNRISRDIHDDIGSGLTRISILSEKIKGKVHAESGEIAETLNRITVQSKEIVSHLGEIVWAVNPSNDTLESLISYLRIYTGNFLENTSYEYTFHAPYTIPDRIIHPDIRHNLLMVLKEALNNAVKYANGDFIEVTIILNDRNLQLSVSDNGSGFQPQAERLSGGNGISNMRARIEAVGGSFSAGSTASGVCITAEIPLD
jgi:signal transduction histidine kinase